jgi:hypothetical protein
MPHPFLPFLVCYWIRTWPVAGEIQTCRVCPILSFVIVSGLTPSKHWVTGVVQSLPEELNPAYIGGFAPAALLSSWMPGKLAPIRTHPPTY